ncbi:hypothetical protein Tsubulata_028484 [Turnera subulata]|uniref:DYW domain-containing protein n=1 Tax=Turnera subulata TaxID=218843 RepID=A0A9Q0FJ42_9ROSI|nr:hypothetical protein Tsubulata_028484 [Turnera subulata]
MKSSNPIFTHPSLVFLRKCRTLCGLKQVHAQMITTGLALHTYPLSRLLPLSCSISVTYCLLIFNQIRNPTVFLFNTLISSLTNQKQYTHIAFSLYDRIVCHKNLKPNVFTYPSLFKVCLSHPWVQHGLALHAHVLKFLEPTYDQFVQASLVNYYAHCGKLGVARYLFNQIDKPDLALWNTMLTAYGRCSSNQRNYFDDLSVDDSSSSAEALYLFQEMQNSQVRPNEVTLVSLISACANTGALSQGTWAHAYVLKKKLTLNHFVGTALVEMYSKCGSLDLARQVFEQLPQRDTFCYNAMIGGLAIHGDWSGALGLYEKMKLEDLVPDSVTFVATMYACSHAGLVEEGCKIFHSIREVYGFEPTVEHYGCIVDLLGRAGRLYEAEETIRKMPMKPNAILWRSLLGGARIHGNLEIGELALKHLVELEPKTSGNYVLLSNMYASINKWEDVNRVRKLMKDYDIVKMPGSSLLEVGGVMHEFIMGDQTHPLSKDIYLKLEEIDKRLHEHGHKPRMHDVLFDIEEEEKETALSFHSEMLAIGFALLVTDSDPIRIMKNLRVCGNCHASTKLISKIYKREIIVRDRSRFHHFKDGTCSCFDYW